jgi:HicB-like protein involved in pilus formation
MAPTPDPLEGAERSHSGRLLLRMPRALHAELAARSDRDGVSLNQWIVSALSRALSEESGADAVRTPRPLPRELRVALIVNAVVIAAAVAVAVVLIVVGWH